MLILAGIGINIPTKCPSGPSGGLGYEENASNDARAVEGRHIMLSDGLIEEGVLPLDTRALMSTW
jgi:hypothetical protein